MEAPEEALASNSSDSISNGEFVHAVVKGKRTKRQRTQPPPPPMPLVLSTGIATSSSASSAEAASGTITEEEEDMANCLILLAQGRAFDAGPKREEQKDEVGGGGGGSEKFTSRKLIEAATTTNGKAGIYVYECKTCSKCFPSFQALGGHRTSHKKHKLAATTTTAEEKKLEVTDDMLQISMNSFSKPFASSSQTTTKPKVHECSICGSEFNSGQALGGHMRRHRPLAIADSQEAKKDKSFLSLDLNLPAPAEDELQRPPSPTLALATKRPLIFSASASAPALVVDCHY
ncbi:hypothetical protein B296_00047717 [Ensete ventricosum]|uniref:C2H2-type domain-containing protein n=1 Tax=Ensete ventricosum TaxID=4639 RepID=A0A426XK10_ENSVE|nr:hypothetical protein B296_00047717 [Ensete ventricosum]